MAAGELAGLTDVINHLPDGWGTQVGEGGVRLSGGQRRRVALARAILCDASVLLLDEPTSGLDAASEQAVLDALGRPGRPGGGPGRRPVVEQGPPAELLAAGGAYARLWSLQRPHEPVLTGTSGEMTCTGTPSGSSTMLVLKA